MSFTFDDWRPEPAKPTSRAPIAAVQRLSDAYQLAKAQTGELVIERMEAQAATPESLGPRALRSLIEQVIDLRRLQGQMALNRAEQLMLVEDIVDELEGLGPLAPYLRDDGIDDIIVNGPKSIYVERGGVLERVQARFFDDTHLMNIIQRIVAPLGRRVDESSPYVDARLPDGSRVNIVIPPIALDGPLLSIRKFRMQALSIESFVERGAMSADMAAHLREAVRARLNVLICGGTGAGKSTLLNMLSSFVGDKERLITIEDAAELQLRQEHVVRLETRPANRDGGREVTARELVKNALRMRPDRIILGEVRGSEAVEMLQAMSTGHDGSMATLHGNSPRDALARLEMLLGFGGLQHDLRALRRFIASSIHLIVHIQRLTNGSRRIVAITEVTGVEGEAYSLNELFVFEEQPPLSGRGQFQARSPRSFFADRMIARPGGDARC